MNKSLPIAGLCVLLTAIVFYLLGNSLWVGFAVFGVAIEIVGWIAVLTQDKQTKNK